MRVAMRKQLRVAQDSPEGIAKALLGSRIGSIGECFSTSWRAMPGTGKGSGLTVHRSVRQPLSGRLNRSYGETP